MTTDLPMFPIITRLPMRQLRFRRSGEDGILTKREMLTSFFGWHNVWFPVYCCFELASIQDRAIFQEYADMVVAVEWNKDVPYYSNIIESLSRDLHCYCVQVNSSDYGDSRIVAPKDSVSKDIIKTKGGQNSCILVDTIDIKSLRDFQMRIFLYIN